jgi:hypothetical protein
MPAIKLETKQYKAVSIAATVAAFPTASKRVSPQTDSPTAVRVSLIIQNTGVNPGFLHFAENVQADGSDIVLAPDERLEWKDRDTTPREAINLGSILGTTWAIIEGVEKSNG